MSNSSFWEFHNPGRVKPPDYYVAFDMTGKIRQTLPDEPVAEYKWRYLYEHEFDRWFYPRQGDLYWSWRQVEDENTIPSNTYKYALDSVARMAELP